ncbi:MAG: amidohydrolase family protein [Anaerolineae bacterium]
MMLPMPFFDANSQVGRYNYRQEGAPYSVEQSLADMQRLGIGRRLVYHSVAKECSPAAGNDLVLREVQGHEGLLPCWAVSTWVSGELPEPEALVATMRRQGVRAARFFRRYYHVPMGEWSLGRLWSALEAAHIPLFFDYGLRWATIEELDADEIHDLCSAHPGLPVILTQHRIRFNRQVAVLLDACPNLRLELSGYWHYRGVEDVVRRFGAERMVFGTNWPYMDSSFAIAAVTYADVSEEERAAVAAGNLAALLEAVTW